MVHAHVMRPYSHSLSDDEQNYRIDEERKPMHDAILSKNSMHICSAIGLLHARNLSALEAEVDHEINEAATRL